MKPFAEALSDLLAQYAETPADEIIDELTLQLEGLRETSGAADDED